MLVYKLAACNGGGVDREALHTGIMDCTFWRIFNDVGVAGRRNRVSCDVNPESWEETLVNRAVPIGIV